ncbi:MAG: phosphatidylserine decarboxylase [Deltaproteobacteria bacterium SM23_61]|nr:MAG: phosphatidylserine decarboxylase [Deltaproteobacteria bacterium SM23_61]
MDAEGRKFPIAKEGMIFILPLGVISLILWIFRLPLLAAFCTLLTLFITYFFRDPERGIPPGDKAVLSPADGKVVQVQPCVEERFLRGPAIKVSVFMSLFNVHVNRNPLSGRIVDSSYSPGKFLRADLDRASAANEQNALLVETVEGTRLMVVQVAGVIARRIVCWVKKGDSVIRGQRFGLIQFGSRLDIYLPRDTRLQVRVGQKTLAGQTILGYLP